MPFKEPESSEDDPGTLRRKLSSMFDAQSEAGAKKHELLVTPGREVIATPPARGASTASLPTPEDAKVPKPNRRQRRAAPVPTAPSQQPQDPLEVQLQAWKNKVAAQMADIESFRSAPKARDPREEEIQRLQEQAQQQAAVIEALKSGMKPSSLTKLYKPPEAPAGNPSPGKSSKPSPASASNPSPAKSSKPSHASASNPSPAKSSKPLPDPAPPSKPAQSDQASPGPSDAGDQGPADVIITPDGATAARLHKK